MHIMICFLCADESRSCLLLCARRVHVCAVLIRLLVQICIVLINTSYEENRLKHTDMANCQRQPQFGCWPEAGLAVGATALATSHPPPDLPLAAAEPGNAGLVRALGLGLSWPASCRSLPVQPQSGHSSSTPNHHANASKPRTEGESLGPMPTAKTPLRCKTQGRAGEDICNCSMHRSSSTRRTDDQEPQVHKFASYRFRVCRHG